MRTLTFTIFCRHFAKQVPDYYSDVLEVIEIDEILRPILKGNATPENVIYYVQEYKNAKFFPKPRAENSAIQLYILSHTCSADLSLPGLLQI